MKQFGSPPNVLVSGRFVALVSLGRQKDDEGGIRHLDENVEIVVAPLSSFGVARIGGRIGLAIHARKVDFGVDFLEH